MNNNQKENSQLLFLHENVTNGGGEKMFRWLGQNLKAQGYNVHFLFMYDNPEIDISGLDADCIGLPISTSYLYRNIRYFTVGIYKMFRYLKKNDIKYIVSFGTNSFYFLGLFKRFLGIKVVVSERADPQFKRFGWLRKKLFAKADFSVFQTQGARNFFTKNKDERTYIIPNPVKLPPKVWNDNFAEAYIVSVGRIDLNHKRQDLLVKAFATIHSSHPDVKLKIVGTGSDKEKLQGMIDELGLRDSVVFTGQVTDVIKELENSRIFVLTSDFEGIPNALLEAMSCGMPVISTDCTPGGAAFLLGEENKYGILVPKGDEQAIAENINMLLENKALRENYGRNARQRVMDFTEEKIIKRWKEVMDRLLLQ